MKSDNSIQRLRWTAYTLAIRYCESKTGDKRIVIWPTWLKNEILTALEKHGFARHEHGGPATYVATTWFITDIEKWPIK